MSASHRNHGRFAVLGLIAAFAASVLPGSAQPVLALSPDVVISQVYGGGGNTGAPYTHDYIELFNRGSAPASLNGWSVQYTSPTGIGNFGSATNLMTELPNVALAPGQYFLIQEATQAAVGAPLPTADVVDGSAIAMGATAGKVALVNSATALGCNGSSTPCPPAALAQIVDLVGYGTANFFEGAAAAPTLTNTTSALRASAGCTETDQNAADFASGAPNPRNTASAPNPCTGADAAPGVSSTTPANAATSVALNANISVTFSEPVDVTGTWFDITCTTSTAHTAAVSGGPTTFTLDPDTDFVASESCTVTVVAAQVTDQDTGDPPDNMTEDAGWTFSTVGASATIREIQGATHNSPLVGQSVSNVPGIVTAKRSNGFYMQDATSDANDATSEGIFVFTMTAPTGVNVGDSVLVAGTVVEFRAATTSLTITEISSPSITVSSTGNSLPAATIVGTGGRVPPTTAIEDDATGDVETSGFFDPSADGIDFYESMESMLVQVNNPVAVGPTSVFGSGATANREIAVLGDDGANASVRTTRGGIVIQANDFNPERIILNDAAFGLTLPIVNVGDHFSGPAVGVIDYSFGNFKLQVLSALSGVSGGLAREAATAAGVNELAVGTFNVENLDPADGAAKFDSLAGLIVNNLRSPDILAIEEAQDNNGSTNDSVVDASATYNALIAAIQTAGGPTYAFRQVDPVDDQDGGEPGGNIRQGFLFRTDRGLAFIDRPGGTSLVATTVINNAGTPELSFSPGRIDPTNAAFNASRKPLVGEFTFNGQTLFVIANHFNSKGGDQPLYGRFQPPTRSSEVQRAQQAQVVNTFVDSILAVDASANVIVAGDINDFEFSSTMTILKGGVLNDLIDALPQSERYSYVFEGNSQTLDHILVSDNLAATPHVFDVVHINSEFADQASDHEPSVARFTLITGTPPDVAINQASEQADPTNASPINFTAVFNEPVTGFANTDVTIGGTAGATTAVVSEIAPNDGTTYNVAVSGMTVSGTVTATIPAGGTQDLDGNGNTASTSVDNTVTWVADTTSPDVTINEPATQDDPTTNSPIHFEVVFSEPVTGFGDNASDVTLGGSAGATTAVVTGGPTTYDVAVTGMTTDGTVTASIPADAAVDPSGNGNTASTSTDNAVTFNFNVGPTASVTNGTCSSSNDASGTLNLTLFDADGDSLSLSLLSNTNPSLVPNANIVLGGSGNNRTIQVTGANRKTGSATLTFNVGDGTTTDHIVITARFGTDMNDTLVGTGGIDMIFGLSGTDSINGNAGNDLLCGGNGIDNLIGGNGNDTLDGQSAADTLSGGNDADALRGSAGNDTLTGGTGADSFSGGSGADTNVDFNVGQGDTSDGT